MGRSVSPELFPDWRDMIAALERARVEFLVVGGFAVAAHGHPRATKDIDLFVRPDPENARRTFRALRQFGAPLHGATVEDLSRPGVVLQLGVPPRRIDIITAIEGVTFEEAAADPVLIDLGDVRMPVIGLAALLTNKRATGRLQDLADVEALEELGARLRGKREATRKRAATRRKRKSR